MVFILTEEVYNFLLELFFKVHDFWKFHLMNGFDISHELMHIEVGYVVKQEIWDALQSHEVDESSVLCSKTAHILYYL